MPQLRTCSLRTALFALAFCASSAAIMAAEPLTAPADPSYTAGEREGARRAAVDIERSCLGNIAGGKRPDPNATDYINRAALRLFELQPPEKFCACTAATVYAVPANVVRRNDTRAIREYMQKGSLACMSTLWKNGFVKFCNDLRGEMVRAYGDKLGPNDGEAAAKTCGCVGGMLNGLSDPEFQRFIDASSDEIMRITANPATPNAPSSASMAGMFASCGAPTMAQGFGFSSIPGLPRRD